MHWIDEVLAALCRHPCCGYRQDGPAAAEPTALAAMALCGHGRTAAARSALDWLAEIQLPDGSVGPSAALAHPGWPTGWALLSWRIGADKVGGKPETIPTTSGTGSPSDLAQAAPAASSPWEPMIRRAAAWLLSHKGEVIPPSAALGHDTTLRAWPWVEGTHSWVEPTAINLLALKACGYRAGDRCREAVRLLCDRAVASGGWNYGNREVLGGALRPHLEPTGLALAALAGEASASGEVAAARAYLRAGLGHKVATASLCYGLIGLAAHGEEPAGAAEWLASAAGRTLAQGASPHRLALLALAAMGRRGPWFSLAKEVA
jgi:hypothetical protein